MGRAADRSRSAVRSGAVQSGAARRAGRKSSEKVSPPRRALTRDVTRRTTARHIIHIYVSAGPCPSAAGPEQRIISVGPPPPPAIYIAHAHTRPVLFFLPRHAARGPDGFSAISHRIHTRTHTHNNIIYTASSYIIFLYRCAQ